MAAQDNPKGEVLLTLGDGVLRLRLTMNAIADIEALLAQPFHDLLSRIASCAGKAGLDGTATRALVWGAMLHQRPDATPRDAGALIDEIGLDRLDGLVFEILEAAGYMRRTGEDEGEAEDGENPPLPPGGAAA